MIVYFCLYKFHIVWHALIIKWQVPYEKILRASNAKWIADQPTTSRLKSRKLSIQFNAKPLNKQHKNNLKNLQKNNAEV